MFRTEGPIFNEICIAYFDYDNRFEKNYVVYKRTFGRNLRPKQHREEV
jgi:hypothetical protein